MERIKVERFKDLKDARAHIPFNNHKQDMFVSFGSCM